MAHVPRAQRFALPVPVRWRARHAAEWIEAVSLNASRTGVLFQSDRSAAVGTEVELTLALSSQSGPWVDAANVNCLGKIVRIQSDGDGHDNSVLAASIDCYSLARENTE
jgi:PilZ domain-containing protein